MAVVGAAALAWPAAVAVSPGIRLLPAESYPASGPPRGVYSERTS
ncbi:MAG TPA: hypothetical protein VJ418_08565 [Streptosporangiaceae bacterium]|nr:hypothetical protein [Streptosporangiaceae bacterium]